MGRHHHRDCLVGGIQQRRCVSDSDLVGQLVGYSVFVVPARRYLYYDVFRVRVRVMEINFYGPILKGQRMHIDNHWNDLLAEDYSDLRFHISFIEAVGRRIRRTYGWIFAALLVCYLAKIFVHPTPLASLHELWARTAIGPIPGEVALGVGLLFHGTRIAVALLTLGSQKAVGLPHRRTGPDLLLEVGGH